MRQVVSPAMVAHLWAHQSQTHARNARSSFHFEYKDLYSYNTVIAKHVANKRGDKAVLLTTCSYSVTTSGKHMPHARRAVTHLEVFHVGNIDGKSADIFKEYGDRLVNLVGKWDKAKSNKPHYLDSIRRLIVEANKFAEFHGWKTRLGDPKDMEGMIEKSRKIAVLNKARELREAKKRLKAQAEQECKDEKTRLAWIEGKGDHYPSQWNAPIRLRVKGNELQTSLGAIVPLAHAKKAFKMVRKCHDHATAWEQNGHSIHLGHFAIERIETTGQVKAGCHVVEWEEIERVAKLVGIA